MKFRLKFQRMSDNVWEPLAEIELTLTGTLDSPTYCLCSRAFIRGKIKGDSLEETLKEKLEQFDMVKEPTIAVCDPDGHPIQFQNIKKPEVEAVSCYCSASHYSTDDYESVVQSTSEPQKDQLLPCPLQNSDSGADLSENFVEKPCCKSNNLEMSWQYSKSKLETAWEKYWSQHGESIIWKSWIEKYGAYINPNYLEQNSIRENLDIELNDITKEEAPNETKIVNIEKKFTENIPVLKISSYPSYGNLDSRCSAQSNLCIDESDSEGKILKSSSFGSYASYEKVEYNGDDDKLKHERVRSRCSNTNLSVRSVANTTVTTDSMTNVTKITLSSLDLSCEECDSVKSSSLLSSSSDDSSGPSSTSSSSSKEEMCTEADMWWKKVWKEHYEDLYACSYQTFAEYFEGSQASNIEPKEIVGPDSPKTTTNPIKLNKTKKNIETVDKNLFKSQEHLNSVGYILSKLDKATLNTEQHERIELYDDVDCMSQDEEIIRTFSRLSERNDSLKRQLEVSDDSFDEVEEVDSKTRKRHQSKSREGEKIQRREKLVKKPENIKQAMMLMGYSFNSDSPEIQTGLVTYRKKNIRGQNRRLKLTDTKPRMHLFFDDDGNPFDATPNESVVNFPSTDERHDKRDLMTECNEPESLGYEAHSSSIEDMDNVVDENKKQRKRKKKQKKFNFPQEVLDQKLFKYWFRRYQLFSMFDKGVRLDAESWYSVTPEKLAKHHAERCRCDVIIDAFCGVGGNSIQFAFTCERVIAIDIDPLKVEMAKHNARIYGVEERIEFIVGNFLKLASKLQADVVFLSPPWGGPAYVTHDVYSLDNILTPYGGESLFRLASSIADDVAFFLPKNTDSTQISLLCGPGGQVEIEQNFIDRRLTAVTAYFGGLIMDPDDPYLN